MSETMRDLLVIGAYSYGGLATWNASLSADRKRGLGYDEWTWFRVWISAFWPVTYLVGAVLTLLYPSNK